MRKKDNHRNIFHSQLRKYYLFIFTKLSFNKINENKISLEILINEFCFKIQFIISDFFQLKNNIFRSILHKVPLLRRGYCNLIY